MDIQDRQEGNIKVLTLNGRLDLASGTELKENLKEQFKNGTTQVHLNLEKIDFVNSSGLGSLVSILKEIRQLKGRLTISNPNSFVEDLFQITQLSNTFEIYETEVAALSSYQYVASR